MGLPTKILNEARADVAVVSTPIPCLKPQQRGRKMEVGASLQMRHEVLRQMAPQYREASSAHKRVVLNDFVRLTGYHRTYTIWLLNHADEGQQALVHQPRRVYEADVEEALVLIWTKTNRLCAKRLIPSLWMFIDSLERHKHLHLTQECRTRLLSMSAATADRLLRSHRQQELRGLRTTRAGTLLKSSIPLRTFEQWDEQVPGFVEADLVAHCGSSVEGSYLFTLVLTDIATGWTECLPLLSKSVEAVLAALQRARSRFPFPLLGLDTDNGTEFMNDLLVAYCEQEQMVRVESQVMHPLEAEEWERLLLVCELPGEHGVIPEWVPARKSARLRVLYDTGMRLSEVCAIRMEDIDLEQGMLMVIRNGFKGRRLPLGHDALEAVRVYVDQHRFSGRRACMEQGGVSDKPLFLSEMGHALTENGIESLFRRLRKRAGMTKDDIGPTMVRDSFVVRYVQAGGDVFTLRDLLGHQESVAVKRYVRMNDEGRTKHTRKEGEGTQL